MKDEPYIPKTEEEKAEAYKLLDDFLKALARRQAFREVVGKGRAGEPAGPRVAREGELNYISAE